MGTKSEVQTKPLQNASHGGVAGHIDPQSDQIFLVAPSTSDQYNLLRFSLIPIACWRVDDIRFSFDSSVVQPEIADEIAYLRKLRDAHRQETPSQADPIANGYPRLSLFGHADPVGSDEYNKLLSGRRSTAIYALLTRRTELWEHLYSQPEGGDNWQKGAVNQMLASLGYAADDERSAVASFQRDQNSPASGTVSSADRSAIFRAYMDLLCTPSFVLSPTDDFLVGADDGGKGDYQGCGEFNPILLFSQAEEKEYAQSPDGNKRNRENAPNRRVVGLFFRVGSRALAEKWPCPRAAEGTEGCKRRFWSDADRRRNTRFPDQRRLFHSSRDTFACRFYQRMSDQSPCEQILPLVQIRLYDRRGQFMPNAPYRLRLGPGSYTGQADEDGWVRIRGVNTGDRATIYWSPKPSTSLVTTSEPTYPFALDLFLDVPNEDRRQAATKQLNNLGYPVESSLKVNTLAFQVDYKDRYALNPNGELDDPTTAAINDAHQTFSDNLRTRDSSEESS